MVLQLCGRVCRRLSFENPVSNETGFFVLGRFLIFCEFDRINGDQSDQSQNLWEAKNWAYILVGSNFEKTEMIKENSGKIYRFKLDHNQGFGFAEIYDFTDLYEFDGRIIYVYNLTEQEIRSEYDLEDIHKSGIAIGPIRIMDFPGTRGKYALKYIGQRSDFLITEIPITKELNEMIIRESNWNNFERWYRSDNFKNGDFIFSKYSELRNLETRILSSTVSVATKFTMKILIDNNKDVAEYYDLNEVGNYNMFAQLINTYYSLEKATELLSKTKNPYIKETN